MNNLEKTNGCIKQLYKGYHLEKNELEFIKPILESLVSEVNNRLKPSIINFGPQIVIL